MVNLKYRKPEEMKNSEIEWIREIPNGWKVSRIKYNARLNACSLSAHESSIRIIRYIDIGSINAGVISEIQNFSINDAPSRAQRIVKANDVIVSTVRTYLKSIAFIDEQYAEYICSTGFAVLSPYYELVYPKFFYYMISSEDYVNQIVARSVGVSYPAINATQIVDLACAFPPLCGSTNDEQNRIANFLDIKIACFDSIISKKEKLIKKLEEAKKSLISEVVTGKVKIVDGQVVERNPEEMKDSGIEWLGMIPRGWQTIRLKHMVALRTKKGEHVPGQQYVGLENIESWTGRLIEPSLDVIMDGQCTLFTKGDVLFCKLRPYLAKCIVATSDGCCTSELLVLESKVLDPQLLKFIMLSVYFIEQVNSSTYGSKMPRANWEFIGSLEIPVFDKLEQMEMLLLVTLKLGHVERLIAKMSEQINLLKEAKQSLIYEAITGNIDLRDWEIIEEGE